MSMDTLEAIAIVNLLQSPETSSQTKTIHMTHVELWTLRHLPRLEPQSEMQIYCTDITEKNMPTMRIIDNNNTNKIQKKRKKESKTRNVNQRQSDRPNDRLRYREDREYHCTASKHVKCNAGSFLFCFLGN